MKVLFVYTNINGFHADSFGDGVAMIMGVTKRAGHDVQQLQIFNKSEYSLVNEAIKDFKPDVVEIAEPPITVKIINNRETSSLEEYIEIPTVDIEETTFKKIFATPSSCIKKK